MSGHNKWTQIKRKKGAEDARRSKLFSILGRTITLESRKARGDVAAPGVRAAIEKARKANMPADNIDRAVKRGVGTETSTLEEILLEAYGPGGAAFLIEAVTDSRNRTVAEIKHLLGQHGSSLASPGAAVWAFTKSAGGWQPTTTLPLEEKDGLALAALVEDLEDHADVHGVYTNAT